MLAIEGVSAVTTIRLSWREVMCIVASSSVVKSFENKLHLLIRLHAVKSVVHSFEIKLHFTDQTPCGAHSETITFTLGRMSF